MKKIFLNILILIFLMFLVNSCQDTLGVDEYSKQIVLGDSLVEENTKVIVYKFIDSLHDTVYVKVPVDTSNSIPEKGIVHKSTLLINEVMVGEYYQDRFSTNNFWLPSDYDIEETVELSYDDQNSPTLDFELKLNKNFPSRDGEYFISKFEFEVNDLNLIHNQMFYDFYNGLNANIEITSSQNKTTDIDNYDNPCTLIIHNITYSPKNPNVPLLMEFEIVSELSHYLTNNLPGYKYVYYGFGVHGLILFY